MAKLLKQLLSVSFQDHSVRSRKGRGREGSWRPHRPACLGTSSHSPEQMDTVCGRATCWPWVFHSFVPLLVSSPSLGPRSYMYTPPAPPLPFPLEPLSARMEFPPICNISFTVNSFWKFPGSAPGKFLSALIKSDFNLSIGILFACVAGYCL